MSRREFVRTAAATSLAVGMTPRRVFAAGTDALRVGLVGCGSRGTGAAINCVESAEGVEIVALGDLFGDQLETCLKNLKTNGFQDWSSRGPWQGADQVRVTPDTCFVGFDAYRKVLACDVDLVLLATPPHFRPLHLRAAVEAGKHVFIEKPVAVDPAGVRSVLESSRIAVQRGLAILAGTQRRHDPAYVEVMKRVHDGAIGKLVAGQCYWNQGWVRQWGFWREPRPEWTEAEVQYRNWYYYTWLSGDHCVEQHVHNLDVINWGFGVHPDTAMAMGGRQVRVEPAFGNIFDHFAVEYAYPGDVRTWSMARQIDGCTDRIGERLVGTRGTAECGRIEGPRSYVYEGPKPNPYVQEHADWIDSIRHGEPINEARTIAEATLTGIMGRMSAYTGRALQWDWAVRASKLDLSPDAYTFGALPVRPLPVPGKSPLV